MSGKYPKGYQIPEKPPVGVLSGWNKITTQRGDDVTPQGEHEFTVPDLVRLLRALRAEFSPERIGQVEELIGRHVAREDNPHQDDLAKMNTSVLQELYLLWCEEGNQGKTREEFLKVLFQYVKIADIATTREGIAHDEVVTALGLKTVVEDHDKSLDAHDALFSYLFPGEPVCACPSFALDAHFELPVNAIVKRESPMWIINKVGLLEEVPPDTLKADYTTGGPAWPLFGDLTNQLEYTENFGMENTWTPSFATLEQSEGIQSPRDLEENAWVLKEVASSEPVCHEISYVRETFFVDKDKYYTISLFVSPMGRDCIGIEVFDIIDGYGRFGYKNSLLLPFDQGTFASGTSQANSYRNVHYKLSTGEVFISDKADDLHGYIYPMTNGWYRIQFTFRALHSMPLQFRIYSLDILDGDENHEGVDGLGLALFGAQANEGPFIAPYIPTLERVKGSITGTTVQLELDPEWYRFDCGTIVTRFLNNAINCRLTDTCEVYNFADSRDSIAHLARMPIGHNNRVYMAGYGPESVTCATQWTSPSTEQWIDIMHGYRYKSHLFGGPNNDTYEIETNRDINRDVTTLYLGCDRYLSTPLNSFLRQLVYYPEYLKPGNMAFFTGRK